MAETAKSARGNWQENLLLGLFYTGLFTVLFVISAYLTFPYDRLRYLIMSKASAAAEAGSGGRTLTIGELSPHGLSGVALKDVELVQASVVPDEPAKVLRLSELAVKLSPLRLLFGERKVDLEAKIGAGSLEGVFTQNGSAQHIEAELNRVDVNELGLGTYVGLPLKGNANGKIDITLPPELPKATGDVKVEIKGLHLGDGKAKVKLPGMPGTGLTLDEIEAGKLSLELQIKDGQATLGKFSTDGKDLQLSGKGNIRLADPLRRSRPDLILEVKFSDSFKNKSDRTRAMFDLMGMRPEFQAGPDGAMRIHVTGSMQALRSSPAR
jgi:type II secretion system protein N